MSDSSSDQNYRNHRRLNPLVHLIVSPLTIVILVSAIARLRRVGLQEGWLDVAIAATLVFLNLAARNQALIVQNRVIVLEMRLRLADVLSSDLLVRARALSPSQLIGLRFASNAELPALVERCVAGELRTADDVKRQVRDWQPDTLRA